MKTLYIVLIIAIAACLLWFVATPQGRKTVNTYTKTLRKADDASTYNKLREVENTCRSMIASYKADILTYEMYRDSDNSEKQGWGEQAKMRANKTASIYNEFILKNSFLWKDNVPADIFANLEVLR